MILKSEIREGFLLYKHAYDKKINVKRDINISWFDEEFGIEILRECLDAIPSLIYENGYLINEDGIEDETVCTFELTHPLITKLGTFEKHLKDYTIDIYKLEYTESFDYFRLISLIRKEKELLDSMCGSFYGSATFFDKSWTTLTIVHEAQMECYDFFKNLLKYLELLEELIPLIKKHFNIYEK